MTKIQDKMLLRHTLNDFEQKISSCLEEQGWMKEQITKYYDQSSL